jgi:hypothetical protein
VDAHGREIIKDFESKLENLLGGPIENKVIERFESLPLDVRRTLRRELAKTVENLPSEIRTIYEERVVRGIKNNPKLATIFPDFLAPQTIGTSIVTEGETIERQLYGIHTDWDVWIERIDFPLPNVSLNPLKVTIDGGVTLGVRFSAMPEVSKHFRLPSLGIFCFALPPPLFVIWVDVAPTVVVGIRAPIEIGAEMKISADVNFELGYDGVNLDGDLGLEFTGLNGVGKAEPFIKVVLGAYIYSLIGPGGGVEFSTPVTLYDKEGTLEVSCKLSGLVGIYYLDARKIVEEKFTIAEGVLYDDPLGLPLSLQYDGPQEYKDTPRDAPGDVPTIRIEDVDVVYFSGTGEPEIWIRASATDPNGGGNEIKCWKVDVTWYRWPEPDRKTTFEYNNAVYNNLCVMASENNHWVLVPQDYETVKRKEGGLITHLFGLRVGASYDGTSYGYDSRGMLQFRAPAVDGDWRICFDIEAGGAGGTALLPVKWALR